jgi:hypothetical protein
MTHTETRMTGGSEGEGFGYSVTVHSQINYKLLSLLTQIKVELDEIHGTSFIKPELNVPHYC